MSAEAVRNRFLQRYAADLGRGAVRSLEEYQGEFPGSEELVARELADLQADEEGVGDEPVARRFGRYRLLRELGRGGQGVVHLARDPRLDRAVALKLSPGLWSTSPEAKARFLREARIASRLDHPGIATVYEAGTTDGVDYIAMRYVPGESLADRIAGSRKEGSEAGRVDARPGFAELAGWFEGAARALHAAHEAGVVHRDVKPGNIVITPAGEPVLLDFGLARELDGLSETLTRTGDFLGTPAYMAPEQLAGDRREVDRRADVYALGVSLYECLALRRPFESATREGLVRAILEAEPRDPRRVRPEVPRRLALVVGKSMAKEPLRRYATALELAEDLRRFRADEPVHARPPSIAFRVRRLARRHRELAFALAGILVLLLLAALFAGAGPVVGLFVVAALLGLGVAGTGTGLIRARRAEARAVSAAVSEARHREEARREAEKARAVLDFLVDVLTTADPRRRGRDVRLTEVLDRAAEAIEGSFSAQPAVSATLHEVLGRTHRSLGQFERARAHYARAVEVCRGGGAEKSAAAIDLQSELGFVVHELGDAGAAVALLQEALGDARTQLPAGHPVTVGLLNNLGIAMREKTDLAGSEPYVVEAWELAERHLEERDPNRISALNNIARFHHAAGRYAEAERLMRSCVAIREEVYGRDDPRTLIARDGLGLILTALGRLDEAEGVFRAARAAFRRVLGEDHLDTLRCSEMLAKNLLDQGRAAEATELLRGVVAQMEGVCGASHFECLFSRANLARALRDSGDRESALVEFEKLWAHVDPEDRRHVAWGLAHAATAAELGRGGRAGEILRALRERWAPELWTDRQQAAWEEGMRAVGGDAGAGRAGHAGRPADGQGAAEGEQAG